MAKDPVGRSPLRGSIHSRHLLAGGGSLCEEGDPLSYGWEIRYGFDPCDGGDPGPDSDGDNDGIKDRNEFGLSLSNSKQINRKYNYLGDLDLEFEMTIRYGENNMFRWGAQPDRKDIFVEVDWMKDGKKEYKMSDEAKEKVILAFHKACRYNIDITLHIDARFTPTNQRLVCILENKFSTDDGCMGGGEAITGDDYDNSISGEEPYRDDPNFHDISRRHIWHYCVFAKKIDSGSPGEGWPGGLSFVVGDTNSIEGTFMHELGHNILGGSSSDYHKGRDGDGHCDKNYLTGDICAMFYRETLWGNTNYCSDCWNDIDLVQCDSNYSGGW